MSQTLRRQKIYRLVGFRPDESSEILGGRLSRAEAAALFTMFVNTGEFARFRMEQDLPDGLPDEDLFEIIASAATQPRPMIACRV